MNKNLQISIVQSDIKWENIDKNLDYHYSLIENLKNQTDIIVLPEMFTTGFSLNAEKLAETMDGKAVKWLMNTAKTLSSVITGSIIIKDNENYYNRMIWAQPDGKLYFYDKRHLFRMAGEHKHYSFGNEKTIFNYKGWNIRPLVCYDLRFPVWSRNKQDYDIAIYIANWPITRAEAWKTLLMARAMENQAFIVGVNRCGIDGMKLNYSGDSRIISPDGKIISSCEEFKEQVITTSIEYEFLTNLKQCFPVQLDSDNFEIL